MTHICVGNLNIIGSDNALSPDWHQAIIWTNAGISLIGPLGTNFSAIVVEIYTFSFKKMHLKMLSWKWRPFCLGLSVLTHWNLGMHIIQCIMWWLVQVMAWHRTGLNWCWLILNWTGTNFGKTSIKTQNFNLVEMHLKLWSANYSHFVQASVC